MDLAGYDLRLIYANDFGGDQPMVREEDFIKRSEDGSWRRIGRPDPNAHWILEGWGGAQIRGGRLWVAPSPFDPNGRPRQVAADQRSHVVVWCRRVFPADVLLEFEFNPCGSSKGLAMVLFAATASDGRDLFDPGLAARRAEYSRYHSGDIANYTDAFWSRNTEEEASTNRLRRNPGFKLVAQGPSLTTGPADASHPIRILKVGAHIEVEVDGRRVVRWDDPNKPLGAGRIGFRTMEGVDRVTFGRIKAWQVERRSARQPAIKGKGTP
jgi:hypothetical protein